MIYFVGIKGVGMTALAQVLQARGYQVAGSDTEEIFMTDTILHNANIPIYSPFDIQNIPETIEYAVVSGAYYQKGIDSPNPEVQALLARNIPLLTYSEALGKLSADFRYSLSVAGSHGKTTTSALLAYTLEQLGVDPFAVIGSVVPQFEGNARIGNKDSEYLVMEADEYQNHFLDSIPSAVIILNIDYDHPDFFPTPELYYQAFITLINRLSPESPLIINGDDTIIMDRIIPHIDNPNRNMITFGVGNHNDIRLNEENYVTVDSIQYGPLELLLPGQHNRMNSLSVIGLLSSLGYEVSAIMSAMKSFKGTKRRLEYIKTTQKGAIVIDDYAHHPKEITASLQAVRERYPDRTIHCIFQPHTFSRTEALIEEFAQALDNADNIYLLPIYASARESVGTVSTQDIVNNMQNTSAYVYENHQQILEKIRDIEHKNSVIVTMGAGDIWKITQNMI
jgi:UDP-N-acetylmuramate--alanine ligase